jgi:hypothetical protein
MKYLSRKISREDLRDLVSKYVLIKNKKENIGKTKLI